MAGDVGRIVNAAMDSLAPESGAGGVAVGVSIAGRTLYFNRGCAEVRSRRPITADTLFNIASVRKPFEATLVAQGVLRGELSLNDPVNKYVGELHGDYIRYVTIGELATHTSGLLLPTDHPPWPNASYTLDEFLAMLNIWTQHSGESPGKQRIYTHAGYILLQLALERRYGTPIGALITDRILRPLGMNSTLVPERGPDNRAIMSEVFLQRAVQGYAANGTAIGPIGNQQSYYDFSGTGQMFSTVCDLELFVAASLNDGPSDPRLREALQLTEREAFRVDRCNAQAMAWERYEAGGFTIVDKPGGLNNASAYLGIVPSRKLGLVILANRGDLNLHELARKTIMPGLAKLQV
ncbi:MAG TPA: serine hydrolase [Xanthobacteraceae bacterium]|nr:serine hydrolase [Xanthobacteraceae bacterium]